MVTAGVSTAILTNIALIGVESALIGSAVLLLSAGIWGFKVLRKAL